MDAVSKTREGLPASRAPMFLFTTSPTRPAQAVPVVDAIRQGAERTGTQFEYLLSTAQRESALDPSARARNSSATGLFQFIEQTWLGLVKSEGPTAGLADYAKAVSTRADGTHAVEDPAVRRAILELRNDPQVASVMAGAFTQKNREVLTSELGREPSAGDLYAAHFLGARGALDLIKAAAKSPTRPIAAEFPDAAASNRPVFFDRQGRARGAAEVYALLAQSRDGAGAAPAFAPDRPVAFARQDGPAFHGLFQSEGRRGPVSEAVAKLWRGGAAQPLATEASLSYFPNSTGRSAVALETRPLAAAPAAEAVPLPPPRPKAARGPQAAGRPLDLASFMNTPQPSPRGAPKARAREP